jgi:NADH-quinone oxidoreductase subunit C
VLPGDEKAPMPTPAATPPTPKTSEPSTNAAAQPQAKGAQSPVTADQLQKADADAAEKEKAGVDKPKVSEDTGDTGAGKPHPDDGPAPADPDVVPTKGEGQNQ